MAGRYLDDTPMAGAHSGEAVERLANGPTGQTGQTGPDGTLVDRIVRHFASQIDERLLRPGVRLPSIRRYAAERQVSRFTVVEAYDRLIARGYVEARPGSGFYVRAQDVRSAVGRVRSWSESDQGSVDVGWLMRNIFRQLPAADMPGGGMLPPDWMDGGLIGTSLRAVARLQGDALLAYGHPQGYLPLRNALQLKLAQAGIGVTPEQLLTTNGVTQAIDLIARHFLKPGDTVLVDDPGWFLMFGCFALTGARVLGVPRRAEGPDLEVLAELAEQTRPKLFVMSSILQNPTGTSLSPARAHGILKLAERFDFRVVDDDIYGDFLAPGTTQSVTRIAALDQLQRVIHLGGFSKTMSANLRVGYIACDPALARSLTDLKMLCGLTSSDLGERVVCRVLGDGHYRRHLERLRSRLAQARERSATKLDALGFRRIDGASQGMFHWVDTGVDSVALAQVMHERGYVMAPGSLFSPHQAPSTWMRLNVATLHSAKLFDTLADAVETVRRAGTRHNRGN